jgi:DinB superfamily
MTMSVDRGIVDDNSKERARLKALVGRLSDADLARPLSAGWTVAGVLGHLAFWDQRIIVLLDAWQRTGAPPAPNRDEDVDWINDAGKPFLLALPPRQAAELTLAIAEAVDGKIETLSDDFAARIAAAGNPISLRRAEHRHEHLGEIEAALRR